MSTLAEIEAAADALPPREKQQLFLHLVKRLRSDGPSVPDPREFSSGQIEDWIAEDEAGMRRFQEAP